MKMKARVVVSILLCLVLTALISTMGCREKTLDHGPLIEAVDTDKDGRLSLDEWQSAGLPMSAFNGLNQNGFVTKQMMLEEGAPEGIDINGDGVLELEEFLEFDKLMSQKMAAADGPGGPPPVADKRPVISDAERALAMWQVQNVMSKHAYYHAAGQHIEELNDIWVRQDGPHAKSAKFSSPMGVWEGMELIMAYYGTYKVEMLKKNLKDISKIYPEVKNVPENIGIGGEWVIHTNTTPIMEVAGDGRTAKGIWYSPGISQSAVIRDGKVTVRGGWFWEKYAVDFVKEDGVWKFWHIQMYYDNTPPGWGADDRMSQGGPPAKAEPFVQLGERTESPGFPQATRPNPDPYQAWSPTTKPRIQPRFPEPYYTFSETFSY